MRDLHVWDFHNHACSLSNLLHYLDWKYLTVTHRAVQNLQRGKYILQLQKSYSISRIWFIILTLQKKNNIPTSFYQRVKVPIFRWFWQEKLMPALNTPSLKQSVQTHDVLLIHIEDRDITTYIVIVFLTGWAFHSVILTTLYHTNNSSKYNIMEESKRQKCKTIRTVKTFTGHCWSYKKYKTSFLEKKLKNFQRGLICAFVFVNALDLVLLYFEWTSLMGLVNQQELER